MKAKRTKPDFNMCSYTAWERIAEHLPEQHRKVYTAFRSSGITTCRELSERSGLNYHMIQRRVKELRRDGYLKQDGYKVVNKRPATLYRIRNWQEAPDVIKEIDFKKEYLAQVELNGQLMQELLFFEKEIMIMKQVIQSYENIHQPS